jgi:hypothetical protein
MINPLEESGPAIAPRRFQFSLRSLFLVSFFLALFFAGIFSHFNVVRYSTLGFFVVVYPSQLLALAIYAQGYVKSFCIGGVVSLMPVSPSGFVIILFFCLVYAPSPIDISNFDFSATLTADDSLEFFLPSIYALVLAAISSLAGGTFVVARWLAEQSRRSAHAAIAKNAPPEAKIKHPPRDG